MSKKVAWGLVLGLLLWLVSAQASWAEEATGSGDASMSAGMKLVKEKVAARQEMVKEQREAIQARVQQLKDNVASKQAELKQRLEEKVRNRVQMLFGIMIKRMRAAVERLNLIADRIETRLQKLSDKGVKTEEMTASLADARSKLKEAGDILDASDAEFSDQVLNSTSFQEGFTAIKETVSEFKSKIKEVHGLLRDVVKEMKVANGQANDETSSE